MGVNVHLSRAHPNALHQLPLRITFEMRAVIIAAAAAALLGFSATAMPHDAISTSPDAIAANQLGCSWCVDACAAHLYRGTANSAQRESTRSSSPLLAAIRSPRFRHCRSCLLALGECVVECACDWPDCECCEDCAECLGFDMW